MNNSPHSSEPIKLTHPPGYYYVGAEIRTGRTKVINARLSRKFASRQEAELVLVEVKRDYPEARLWFDVIV